MLKKLLKITGRRGAMWLIASAGGAILLAGIEYCIAAFVQVFLAKVDLIHIENLPSVLKNLVSLRLELLLLLLIIIGVLRSLGTYTTNQASRIFMDLFNIRMRLLCYYQILLRKNASFVSAGHINSQIAEVFPKAGLFIFNASNSLSQLVIIVGLCIGLAFTAWKETLVGIAGLFLLGIGIRALNKQLLSYGRGVPYAQAKISRSLDRILRNWIFIKIAKLQKQEYRSLLENTFDYSNRTIKAGHFANLSGVLPPAIGIVLLSFIIILSQEYFHTPSTRLLGFLYLFVRFVQMLGGFVLQTSNALTNKEHFRMATRFFLSFDDKEIHAAVSPLEKGVQSASETSPEKKILASAPRITINDLVFKWQEDSPHNTIDHLILDIDPGQVLVIVGPSGVGKSTLLSLILGQLKPTSGSIHINGISPEKFLEVYGGSIGYVGADPFIIDGTVKDNLLYGLEDIPSDETVWQSLAFAKMDYYIKALPEQLDYKLNEIGEGLSTGQKQRIALARAWLRQPKLWILDEATANLDKTTEDSIIGALSDLKQKCTILVVTHKQGLLRIADRVLELEGLYK